MARAWASKTMVEDAVSTIVIIFNETGTLPDDLKKACTDGIQNATFGQVQYFYSELAKRCPQALKSFVVAKTE